MQFKLDFQYFKAHEGANTPLNTIYPIGLIPQSPKLSKKFPKISQSLKLITKTKTPKLLKSLGKLLNN